MTLGIIGTKIGMTRVFSEAGVSTSVTVVHAPANSVVQVKNGGKDGYRALQVGAGRRKRASKALAGHYAKSGASVARTLREFRVDEAELRAAGDKVSVGEFSIGQDVNVTGVTKGKGFAGGIKRHNFSSLDMSHGNSLAHRSVGSTGQCQTPGKVFKGKKMPGQLGNVRATIKNLKIMEIDEENELLMISGSIPGSNGQTVIVRSHVALVPQAPEEAPEETPEETPEAAAPEAAPAAKADEAEEKKADESEEKPAEAEAKSGDEAEAKKAEAEEKEQS